MSSGILFLLSNYCLVLIIIHREPCLTLCLGYVKIVASWQSETKVLERKGDIINRSYLRAELHLPYLMQKSSLFYWKPQTK